mgnify:CR=1 FL=1
MSNAKNRHGNVYCYFVCSGRHSKRTDCTRQAMLIEDVEKLVEDYYTRVQITPAQQDAQEDVATKAEPEAGDVFFGTAGQAPKAGNYDWMAVIHELGHTLGLKHPHDSWGYDVLTEDMDRMEDTVMSYNSYVGQWETGYTNGRWDFAQTFMARDIAALQHMYGADYETQREREGRVIAKAQQLCAEGGVDLMNRGEAAEYKLCVADAVSSARAQINAIVGQQQLAAR